MHSSTIVIGQSTPLRLELSLEITQNGVDLLKLGEFNLSDYIESRGEVVKETVIEHLRIILTKALTASGMTPPVC